ncbi:unnamed protein product [Cylindrotheca closterium]|uniref:Thioredoxin domain-containing protein n=1 Tax=Cylindrotheca closterium TaxID=2856 RepID=A0AAD2G7U1_9STRA|nr:unnamed protein product [Cylindrotheca closterium]
MSLGDAALQAKLTVIDFTATWCGPCRAIAPMFEALSKEIDDVVFVKCDVDEAPGIAQRFSVRTFVFVKAGAVVDRLQGANPQRLRELIEEHM